MGAALIGSKELVQIFLDNSRPNVNAKNKNGLSVLHVAVHDTSEEAITADQADVVKLLLEHGADVNAQDKDNEGETPLMTAITRRIGAVSKRDPDRRADYVDKLIPVIKVLLADPKIEINRRDREGRTVLGYAEMAGAKKVTQLLKSHGAKE
ncbi:MAG: ankyrin repeat domain-containing protein [Elusimicrobia bacterium]|nr:ankyrin repeat domain-containing protein [Elusimicrobiota bacterium]